MEKKPKKTTLSLTRRGFLKTTAQAGAAVLLLDKARVHAAGSDKIKVGLIGCGGRGTGAGIIDCAQASKGIELVAIGDLFQDHADKAVDQIVENLRSKNLPADEIVKVTPDTTFVGFDAYRHVIASDVDLVILTTPPNFRPQHLRAAVEAGKHVFIEKPVAVDPAGVRSVIETSELARQKGLTLVAGTQMRRLESNREAIRRIHDGAIGKITGGQVVRCGGGMRDWRGSEKARKPEWTDVEYALRRWLFWTWLSGDFIVEMHVHNLDVMNWILRSHPVQAMGVGGRQARTEPEYGNVYDHFSVEYLYPDDVRIEYIGAQIDKISSRSDQRVTGTKGSAYLDFGNATIKGKRSYTYEDKQPDPQVTEYADTVESIRKGRAVNEGRQIAETTMTAILGRMSAYTGRAIKWDWAMEASKLDLGPIVSEFGALPEKPVAVPGVTELI